jgi:hypothetical protein
VERIARASALVLYPVLLDDFSRLLVPPSEMTKISLKRLFRTFEIRPSIETVALGKSRFMGVQQMSIDRERDQLDIVLKNHSVRCWFRHDRSICLIPLFATAQAWHFISLC